MTKLPLSLLLIAVAVAARAEPGPAPTAIQPAVDSSQERQTLRKLSTCVAQLRPRWARTMLSYPYLSEAQASVAAELVSGRDNCLGAPEVAVAFRTSGVVGSVAEYFVRAEIGKTDSQRLAIALATVAPLNVSEDFALCLAARNPVAARDLTLSEPGSVEEAKAAKLLAASLPSCTKAGERLDVDLQSLRALAATALYRAMTAANPPRATAGR